MGTRAIYTFKDKNQAVHVYKHYDGYPEGAVQFINNAIPHAWPLPRFKADEFASAFVKANKPERGGDVRLVNKELPWEYASDVEFWYIITQHPRTKALWVDIKKSNWYDSVITEDYWVGTLAEALDKWYSEQWKEKILAPIQSVDLVV